MGSDYTSRSCKDVYVRDTCMEAYYYLKRSFTIFGGCSINDTSKNSKTFAAFEAARRTSLNFKRYLAHMR
jgi:hypothetical protein